MRNKPGQRLILILATLLVFIFGIFGIPHGVTPSALKAALLQRIHLGLDLKAAST